MSLRLVLCLIVALFVSGCGSAPPARPDLPPLTPLAELPDHYRELWGAWLEEAPDWNERRQACGQDPAACTFLVENLAAVFLGSYPRSELQAHGSGGHGFFERARAELLILKEDSVPTLMELHVTGDGATAYLTAEVLTAIGTATIPACLEYMDRPQVQARRRAVHLLGQLPYGHDLEPQVRSALAGCLAQDEDWLVRKSAAVVLAQRGGRHTILHPARKALEARIAALGGRAQMISRELSDNEVKSLFRCVDVFVSLHRSEGFGRGMAEAMALGTPVAAR